MIQLPSRTSRWAAPVVLSAGFFTASPVATQALAQDPNEPEGDSKGRPLDGYLGSLCLIMLAFFIVGKSARRS